MLGPVIMSAVLCGGAPYAPSVCSRPIASLPAYPEGMADDVRRPGFNGRLHVTRPIMGSLHGPGAESFPAPGPDAYGAYLDTCPTVPARVGHLVIGISPWAQWAEQGHKDLEHARQFWLRENGYTGGVRTFVNDYYLFSELREPAPAARGVSKPEPAAIIELAPEAPRNRHRLRVQLPGDGPSRISWPSAQPAAVAVSAESRAILAAK
jgi:hypothetical protein